MKITVLILVAVVAASGCLATAAARAPLTASVQPACWNPGAAGATTVDHVRELVAATDPDLVALRDSLGLPAVADSAVQPVTDEATCARALTAHAATYVEPERSKLRSVFVVAVGPTRFVVWDGRSQAGEFALYHVYDRDFRHLGAFTA